MITITDREHGLPFSKGLLAQAIMATGLNPTKAYEIATDIHDQLKLRGECCVTTDELREMATSTITVHAGEAAAVRYNSLHNINQVDRPLVILIGGTTGVGKSTLAVEIAHRLGITRMTSTDSIREVMRGIFNPDLMPTLYESAFEAWRGLRVPIPQGSNPVIVGFREQAAIVLSGVKSIIERAAHEGYSVVIEGVHLAPGYLDPTLFKDARVVQFIVGVKTEDQHLSHFHMREVETQGNRPTDRYEIGFENIRALGEYVQNLAQEHDVPLVYSHQLEQAVEDALNIIMKSAIDAAEEHE